MQLAVTGASEGLTPRTALLLDRMLRPFTGLTQAIGFVLRDPFGPAVSVAGGEMTGVHMLHGGSPPRAGAYHIGGSGMTFEECIIRTLGETVERYSHVVALAGSIVRVQHASYKQMQSLGRRCLVPEALRLYGDEQLSRDGFPFAALSAEDEIGWVAGRSLLDGSEEWVPAQQAIVGYHRRPDEVWFTAGVTTGSAAHTDLLAALRNALLELVQLDAAVGHWYGARAAVKLGADARTSAIVDVVRRAVHPLGSSPTFYQLPSPDLPGFAVACVLADDVMPRAAVGLGCDLRLEQAMYKAFLEGTAVAQLAKIVLFRETIEAEAPEQRTSTDYYDLDSNVAHYARVGSTGLLPTFGSGKVIAPSELPPDVTGDLADDVRLLLEEFRRRGLRITAFDLTTPDVAELGFRAVRVWSPDLLPLPLPSAPPLAHPRFAAYGGPTNAKPHPFP